MTAMSKTLITSIPATGPRSFMPGQLVGAAFASVKRRWTSWRNRRHVLHLRELDDYLLRDIGLQHRDIDMVLHLHGGEDPTQILNTLADVRLRFEANRYIH
ncbi:DUF1127 domain-containing protein [Falsochrobactrum sp. TDYN1]|uniref:DUF1127 domain-containing protein n=1 Tax=Falsochrobactrum tianjinense TaxID=2706015 RepID=A0A949PQ52_9HYPH|nr:DUF1127 domain-containing protein [Falsochrobactrum sp. TDYN1]MBV2144189.1 DUF1127 domain-containing protein [Falsochrobactrum sp. TDYN1]